MPPVLNSIGPTAGPPGETVLLGGSAFSGASVQIVSQDPTFPLTPETVTLTPLSQSATKIAFQLPASLPGQAGGSIDLAVTVVNGDASASAPLIYTVTFIGWVTIARVAGSVPAWHRGGQISDDQVWEWIATRAQIVTGAMQKRGYPLDPSAWPSSGENGTSPEAMKLLSTLNRLGAAADLAEAIGGNFSTGRWGFAKSLSDQFDAMFRQFREGVYDHLFVATASTDSVDPTFSGFPDNSSPDCGGPAFRKGERW